MLYIGNHTSSSRGYLAMGKQMLANGGNTFAFFTRNPRGGNAKAIDPADVAKFQEIAREHDIEIVENKPLARMLYANVDIGGLIPPELYQAVAEVLAFVYHLKGKA